MPSPPEPCAVEVAPGATVAVVELGRPPTADLGPAAPWVLVPGLSDGLAPVTLARTRALLAEAPLPLGATRCLAVSYREPLPSAPTTAQLAADLATALMRLLSRPAVLVCHSLGAMVAQHLAVDAPDLVAGLVLSATVPAADDDLRAVLDRWAALVTGGRFADLAEDAIRTSFTGAAVEERVALARTAPADAHPPARVARHLALTHACATHDARDRLHAIACPTLVLAGAKDVVAPPHHARTLATAVPGAVLAVLPGVGHGFPEQDPEGYRSRVTAFLRDAGLAPVGDDAGR